MNWIEIIAISFWGLVQISTMIARIRILSKTKKQAAAGSYRQLSKSLGNLRNEYISIAIKDRNTPEAKRLLKEVYNLDAELKAIANSLGTWTRHINKYQMNNPIK